MSILAKASGRVRLRKHARSGLPLHQLSPLVRAAMSTLLCVAALCVFSATAQAQSENTAKQVDFDGSIAIIKEKISGKQVLSYAFDGLKWQQAVFALEAPTLSANFNLEVKGEETPLFVGARDGKIFDVELPRDGRYRIDVFLMGPLAETGSTDFTLTVFLDMATQEPDYGEALGGGPDYWEVVNLLSGDHLNVRKGPTTAFTIIGQASNGDLLANQGCNRTGKGVWCKVESLDGTLRGWAVDEYLSEGPYPDGVGY